MLQARFRSFQVLTSRALRRNVTAEMNSREEIKRVIAASGEPPSPGAGADTAHAVWARIGHPHRTNRRATRLSWLPRGWELACAFGSALALGVISAEWRLRDSDSAPPAAHRRYLASIDPTLAAPLDHRP